MTRRASRPFSVQVPDDPCATVWMQASVAKAKTAIGARSRLLLPLIAPVSRWLEHRAKLGLACGGDTPLGSVIPAFTSDGDLAGRPMTSQEITRWLRSALASAGAEDAERLSSHSLKASCLTWASQAGVGLDLRRLLAHHVHGQCS